MKSPLAKTFDLLEKVVDVLSLKFNPDQPRAPAGSPEGGQFGEGGGGSGGSGESKPRQIDTPEFKKWFGKSKVVDKHGEPLVVYHGTASPVDFSEFVQKPNTVRPGIWFSGMPELADSFATHETDAEQTEHGRIIPTYLSIQNPFYTAAAGKEVISKARKEGHDGIIVEAIDRRERNYVVFKPEQIKSAIGNRGTFDPDDPDITKSIYKGEYE